jgi:hypothetical protein
MAQNNAKKDLISSIRFYVDKIVSDPSIGGKSNATFCPPPPAVVKDGDRFFSQA